MKSIEFKYKEATAKLVWVVSGKYRLTNVWSPIRGKGQAGGVMEQVTKYADEHKLILTLVVQPYGHPTQSAMMTSRLKDFYETFGFKKYGMTKPVTMIRYPFMDRPSQEIHGL